MKTNWKAIACLLAFIALCSSVTSAQDIGQKQSYASFSNWGLTFDYPKGWQAYPADQVAMIKESMERELRPFGRKLKEVAVFVEPNNEAILLVLKYTTPRPMKPSDFLEERKKVHEDAKRAGDVTKVNHVKETAIAKRPAVEEDVERSNGGRGRNFKVLDASTVFEISLIVNRARQFSKYSAILDHLPASINVAGKTERR